MGHYAKRFFGKKIEEPRDPDFVFTVDCKYKTVCRFSLREGPKDVVIDWGNGKTTSITSDAEVYPLMNYNLSGNGGPGIYQIRIKGSFPGIFPNTDYLGRLISLDQWGTNEFTTMEGMFRDETKMEANYTDRPNTSNVTNMRSMFSGCSKFNGKVDFNTQNVTHMNGMFNNCAEFNQEVNFDTQNVTTMQIMFQKCAKFNQKVEFDTSNVTTMGWMFYNCAEFNQKVNFDTSNVTTMQSMFNNCAEFNQEVNFNTSNVTNMSYMFNNCAEFNQEVNFDTSNVTTMRTMFQKCAKFNQKVEFNTQNVTSMSYMFAVTPVQQSFASWDVTNLIVAINFITLGDMNEPGNTDNYDNTLISWASQDIQQASPVLDISFGSSKYSSRAKSARDFLESKNWSIKDGGMI